MNASEVAPLLPEPAAVRERSRLTALLEFLVAPGNRYRLHDYATDWRPGWDLATMSNGGGDDYSVALSDSAGLIRCFDHESEVSPYINDDLEYWPGTVDALPDRFRPFLDEAGFTGGDEWDVTALLWFLPQDTAWRTGITGHEQDGSDWLLRSLYTPDPARVLHERFQDYYEKPIDLAAVSAFFEGEPLTEELAAALNPGAEPAELLRAAAALLA
ncbi:hypothetical protein [Nocardiopsis ganjiahuensis]|uniref:hypothetical protein n=1 Tax=Nocardiopsis ganjiahuensis TaxID=239984 RepID=UPI0003490926|nr:hypothetical protein [Nocardiopsis ganjiahuensis]